MAEKEKVQIGKPCEGCALFSDQRTDAGVGYCAKYCTWQHPDSRLFDCQERIDGIAKNLHKLEQQLGLALTRFRVMSGVWNDASD